MNPTMTKNYLSGAAIAAARVVKFGADEDHVIQGAAAADALIGVLDHPAGADAAEERVDVIHSGIAEVEAGAAVTAGDLLMSDAVGRAIVAAAGAGTNVGVIGRARADAVLGDIFDVILSIGSFQG